MGLSVAYREQSAIHNYVRELLALPFLPPAQIRPTFEVLKSKPKQPELIHFLVQYIEIQWIDNAIFPAESWCVCVELQSGQTTTVKIKLIISLEIAVSMI